MGIAKNCFDCIYLSFLRTIIPEFFKNNIDFTNSSDPLLMQVLPRIDEIKTVKDFSDDPVGDLKSKKSKNYWGQYLSWQTVRVGNSQTL